MGLWQDVLSCIVDIALNSTNLEDPTIDAPPSMKLGGFDWKGKKGNKGKQVRMTEDSDAEQERPSQPVAFTSSQT